MASGSRDTRGNLRFRPRAIAGMAAIPRCGSMLAGLLLLLCIGCASQARPLDDAARSEPAADAVDFSCERDEQCVVKDVGNCCGYYPACVNVDSPTFPERVKAQCAREGTAGICGFPQIAACRCVERRCEASANGAQALPLD